MINIFKRYRNSILVLVLLAVGFFIYSTFIATPDAGPLTAQSVDTAQTAVEQELIGLLLELRSIQLDLSLFDNPNFRSLTDFSQELVPEPTGRSNPFSPLE